MRSVKNFFNLHATLALVLSTLLLVPAPAHASDVVYRPVNPSFGGNSLNSNHLMAIANAQNDYKPPAPPTQGGSGATQTPAQAQAAQFLAQLQSRLIASLATQVTEAIFGAEPQNSGQVVFGTQTVDFERGLTEITITLTDTANKSSTNISVPIFTTGN